MTTELRALIIGVTGIVGSGAAERLLSSGWDVTGVSRRAPRALVGVRHVRADLSDRDATVEALRDVDPTHVFFTTWSRQDTEAENIRVNGAMLRNVLEAVERGPDLRHFALVTGLKHYFGPFESYGHIKPDTPYREDQGRVPYPNFYYEQEGILFEAAEGRSFTWSVHRAHTVIGWALGNVMNMGITLSLYGSVCRETGRPFVFPGSPEQWDGVTDVTDARLLARHLEWAASEPRAANEAFNVVNGDVFRWRRMWGVVADGLGVEPAPYPGHATPLVAQMADAAPIWHEVIERHRLVPHSLDRLASWWHTDADLGRPFEAFASMTKSRSLGFLDYQNSEQSFLELFERLRGERVIPEHTSPRLGGTVPEKEHLTRAT